MRKRFASRKISYPKTDYKHCHCFRLTQKVKAATSNAYVGQARSGKLVKRVE